MSIVNKKPLPHRLIVQAVSTTIINDVVTEVKVNLESIGILAVDMVQFVEDNDLWSEILSKAGLSENLVKGTGTLTVEDDTHAPTYFYTITFQIGSSA